MVFSDLPEKQHLNLENAIERRGAKEQKDRGGKAWKSGVTKRVILLTRLVTAALEVLSSEKQQLKRKGRKVRKEIQRVPRVILPTRWVTPDFQVFPLRSFCSFASSR